MSISAAQCRANPEDAVHYIELQNAEILRLQTFLGRALDELERISVPEDDVDGLCAKIAAELGRAPLHQQTGTEPK